VVLGKGVKGWKRYCTNFEETLGMEVFPETVLDEWKRHGHDFLVAFPPSRLIAAA
jgi:hypothetical protein